MGAIVRWLTLVAAILVTAGARGQGAKPNIIFILADDLGYGDVGCYGQKRFATPNIDRLAADGMRFTQFYSGSPVCAPSRCTLLTGLHSGHAYVRDNRELKPAEGQEPLPADTVTLAKVLKDAGYTTACIGKWGLGGPGSTGAPEKQGFDHFFGYLCQRKAHRFFPESLWRNGELVVLEENAGGKRGVYSHDLMTNEALEFVSKSKPGQPFFLYLPFTIPHFDLDVPDDSMAPFKDWPETPKPADSYQAQARPRAAYAGMITRMDRDIGRLMALLKEKGIDNDTLVIFASDNGPTLLKALDVKFFDSAAGLRGLKQDVYEGGIRVPFIVRWPGKIQAGKTSDFAGAFWDVLPTLAEVAGAKTPAGLDGISIAPTLLDRGEQRPHEYLYWEFPAVGAMQAVRMGDWKGVRTGLRKNPNGPIELYDLKGDPSESRNIAAQHPEVVAKIAGIMKAARVESEVFPLYRARARPN